MTESKEMSARIRKASGRDVREEEPPEVVEALASISEDLSDIKEALAMLLENVAGGEEAADKPEASGK